MEIIPSINSKANPFRKLAVCLMDQIALLVEPFQSLYLVTIINHY